MNMEVDIKIGGKWEFNEDKITAKFQNINLNTNAFELNTEPCIYFWVIKSKTKTDDTQIENGKVIYVGKAGKGLRNRMKEHEGGFKKNGSKSGIKRNAYLKEFNSNYDILVYYKIAAKFDCKKGSFMNLHLDKCSDLKRFRNLTFFSFEEEFYIKYFGIESNGYLPPLNGKPNYKEGDLLKKIQEFQTFFEVTD